MYVYNPEDFDPCSHLPKLLHRYADCARMLVHIVAVRHAWDGLDELDYTPLKASILRRQVHPHFTEAIRDALIGRVIECDGLYVVDEKCLGYRLAASLRRRRFVPVELTNRGLIRRNQAVPRIKEPEIRNEVHEMIWSWLNRTEIDYAGAVERLVCEKGGLRNMVRKSVGLEQLRARELFFTSDRQGRVYHNVANLWSELRPFLRLNGERLVNLDIGNSQPLIFSICMRNYFSGINNEKQSSLSPLTYISDAHKMSDGLAHDARRYIELTERGQLYEYLMAEFGIDPKKRSGFKCTFFANVFYSKTGKRSRHLTGFAERFPSVYEVIRHFKKADYKDLSRLMQRTEADLMIGTVCEQIIRHHRNVPFLTIHDSVVTTPEHAGLIKLIIAESFAAKGLRPTIQVVEY